MAKLTKVTEEDEKLLSDLGIEAEVKKKSELSPREERIIAGFEEIQKFVEENGVEPSPEKDKDIFERLYANRLEQIRSQSECIDLLKDQDHQSILNEKIIKNNSSEKDLDGDALLTELGLDKENSSDITNLKNVKPRSQINPAKEVGQRTPCKDFNLFKPLFEQVQKDIKSGVRKVLPFRKDGSIEKDNLFILSGQKVFIAEVGDPFKGADGRNEYRLRVIFDNGVESNQLMHSLQKRLYDDENGRRITDTNIGPLFDDQPKEGDTYSGVIYVCQSNSEIPKIKENRNNIHKIGVTKGTAKARISGAKDDPTFLFADVSLKATFELYGIEHLRLEKMIHDIFASAKLDIEISDRFGKPYKPQEWFLVSLETIEDAVQKIKEGSIINYKFDIKSGILIKNNES